MRQPGRHPVGTIRLRETVSTTDVRVPEAAYAMFRAAFGPDSGRLVRCRPLHRKYSGQTFLGIYIGDLPVVMSAHVEDHHTIAVEFSDRPQDYSPAFFIPQLKCVMLNCQLWWSWLDDPSSDIPPITDEEIDKSPIARAILSVLKRIVQET